jgi:Raf kinase inhibitor-like YbhB/YbcL family protein
MKKTTKMLTLVTMIAAASLGLAAQGPGAPAPGGGQGGGAGRGRGPQGPGLTLTTTAFADGAEIPVKYTSADPNGVSPKLEWTNVPAGTVTFALIFHDPDVALQKNTDDVLHWMIFNIPGTAKELPEAMPPTATLPDGTIQAKNIRGAAGYMGPGAPAPGPHHHYTFELFALDTKLDLTPDATRADVLKAMQGHILGKGVLVGRFHR